MGFFGQLIDRVTTVKQLTLVTVDIVITGSTSDAVRSGPTNDRIIALITGERVIADASNNAVCAFITGKVALNLFMAAIGMGASIIAYMIIDAMDREWGVLSYGDEMSIR